MARRKKTDLPTAALIVEMKKTEGRTEKDIAAVTGVPASTVHRIVSGANGWDEVAEGEVFKEHRRQQNKALEQANRTLAKKALEAAEGKIKDASFYQLVYGAAIMTDKARLLAGESTQHIEVHTKAQVVGLDKLCEMLGQSLIPREKSAIDVTEDQIPAKLPSDL